MGEIKRVLCSPKLWIALAICVFLNICLFIREQQSSNYGFPDASAEQLFGVRKTYLQMVEQYEDRTFDEAMEEIGAVSELAYRYDRIQQMLSVRDVMLSSEEGRQQWDMLFAYDYDNYRESYPELFESLENGTLDTSYEDIVIRSKAASKLLPQVRYLQGYASYLTSIQENSERMKKFSIFNTDDGFAAVNIDQTAQDFAGLEGVQVKLDNYQDLESFFSFSITDYLLLFGIFLIVAGFSEGRKAGLWQMLFAAAGGRCRLAFHRILALLAGITVISFVLYGSSFFTGAIIYGGIGDLSQPVQSLELFGKLPLRISFFELLGLYFLLRIFTAFLIGLLFWLILMAFRDRTKLSFVVIVLLLGVEYVLYRALTDQSALNFFKYFNLFLYIDAGTFLQRYLNLNLFGMAVHIGKMAVICGCGIIALTGSLCVWMDAGRYPERKSNFYDRIALQAGKFGDRFRSVLTWTGWEYYKILVMYGGVLVLAAFFVIVARMDYSITEYPSMVDVYMEDYAGEITEETWQQVDKLRADLNEGVQIYEDAVAAVQAEEISSVEYLARIEGHEHDQDKLFALEQFASILEEKEERGQKLGIDLSVVYEVPYRMIYGEQTGPQRMQRSLVILLALALLLAGTMTMEQTSPGLKQSIRSTRGGRYGLLMRKVRILFGLVFLLWLFPSLLEISAFLKVGDKAAFHTPVQSLTFLSEFPLMVSISGFLLLMYLCRLFVMLLTGELIVFLSSTIRRTDTSYLAACGVFAAPAAMWIYMELDVFRWMTPASLIDVFSMVTAGRGSVLPFAIAGSGYFFLSAICHIMMIRRWCM